MTRMIAETGSGGGGGIVTRCRTVCRDGHELRGRGGGAVRIRNAADVTWTRTVTRLTKTLLFHRFLCVVVLNVNDIARVCNKQEEEEEEELANDCDINVWINLGA
jgi:hypothetical protein